MASNTSWMRHREGGELEHRGQVDARVGQSIWPGWDG